MDEIIAHIEELSKLSPYIKLYRNFDPKIILKHIGKLQERLTDNMSIFIEDKWCFNIRLLFLGIKEP
ncbi:MAG: hypothetical protein ACLVEE_18560 [Phocaeicola vulgatus]